MEDVFCPNCARGFTRAQLAETESHSRLLCPCGYVWTSLPKGGPAGDEGNGGNDPPPPFRPK